MTSSITQIKLLVLILSLCLTSPIIKIRTQFPILVCLLGRYHDEDRVVSNSSYSTFKITEKEIVRSTCQSSRMTIIGIENFKALKQEPNQIPTDGKKKKVTLWREIERSTDEDWWIGSWRFERETHLRVWTEWVKERKKKMVKEIEELEEREREREREKTELIHADLIEE